MCYHVDLAAGFELILTSLPKEPWLGVAHLFHSLFVLDCCNDFPEQVLSSFPRLADPQLGTAHLFILIAIVSLIVALYIFVPFANLSLDTSQVISLLIALTALNFKMVNNDYRNDNNNFEKNILERKNLINLLTSCALRIKMSNQK